MGCNINGTYASNNKGVNAVVDMSRCDICNREKYSMILHKGKRYCGDCYEKMRVNDVMDRMGDASVSELKCMSGRDLVTAFYESLGNYQKNPNKKDLDIMIKVYRWACHADHTVSTSIIYALKWCGINSLYREELKFEKK